jgi:hypothetical protein
MKKLCPSGNRPREAAILGAVGVFGQRLAPAGA